MKVALVHDYLKEYGGAERVLEALHELYPDAPVYTSVYLPRFLGPHRDRFKSWDIRTTFLQHVPFKAKLISPMRLLGPVAFQKFDFSSYDVIIVSATGASYSPNMIHKRGAVQICYCHTPPRYLYGYATAREWKRNVVMKALGSIASHLLRAIDVASSRRVDEYIANSQEVRKRIAKFYRRDATVIHPPVDIPEKSETMPREQFYLTGGRLARPKHIDVIVKTCTEKKLPLKVFGKAFAGYGEELKEIAGQTVEFLGEVSDEEKERLMEQAEAFLFASEDEDFGITPIEAMAHGLPVIAYRSGGVQETVEEGETGLFFDELSSGSLGGAIEKYEKKHWDREACRKHARQFGKERFQEEIAAFVEKTVKK